MKATTQSTEGTSFFLNTIQATPKELTRLFGAPDCGEWALSDSEGNVLTVYDQHERTPQENELIEWHIGGDSWKITQNAEEEIETLLKTIR